VDETRAARISCSFVPHLPFVHARTIGKSLKRGPDARMDIHMEERPTGWNSTIELDGVSQEGSLEFRWPNQMVLSILVQAKTLVLINTCIPTSGGRSRLLVTTVRSFLKFRLFDGLFNWSNRRIVREDKAVVESSSPAEIPRGAEEQSTRTDAPTLYFRKRYHAELAQAVRPKESASSNDSMQPDQDGSGGSGS
jgi:phenylpropionate dioxygenase-like ring-hydroxylating dioxygenase large terminal subunit